MSKFHLVMEIGTLAVCLAIPIVAAIRWKIRDRKDRIFTENFCTNKKEPSKNKHDKAYYDRIDASFAQIRLKGPPLNKDKHNNTCYPSPFARIRQQTGCEHLNKPKEEKKIVWPESGIVTRVDGEVVTANVKGKVVQAFCSFENVRVGDKVMVGKNERSPEGAMFQYYVAAHEVPAPTMGVAYRWPPISPGEQSKKPEKKSDWPALGIVTRTTPLTVNVDGKVVQVFSAFGVCRGTKVLVDENKTKSGIRAGYFIRDVPPAEQSPAAPEQFKHPIRVEDLDALFGSLADEARDDKTRELEEIRANPMKKAKPATEYSPHIVVRTKDEEFEETFRAGNRIESRKITTYWWDMKLLTCEVARWLHDRGIQMPEGLYLGKPTKKTDLWSGVVVKQVGALTTVLIDVDPSEIKRSQNGKRCDEVEAFCVHEVYKGDKVFVAKMNPGDKSGYKYYVHSLFRKGKKPCSA